MPLAALTRLRLARLLRVLVLSALIGALYGTGVVDSPSPLARAMVGVVNGALIGGCIAWIEMFALRSVLLRPLATIPFVILAALKTLVYGAIAAAILGSHLGERVIGVPVGYELVSLPRMVGFALVVTLLFVIVLQAAGLVGYRTFRSLLLGRYRQPPRRSPRPAARSISMSATRSS